MRKMITAALVATMLGCGGAPVATPAEDAGIDATTDAGWDAGWPPDSGEVPTDCTPGDGPCCSGSGYFMLAGTPCGSEQGTTNCYHFGAQDMTQAFFRIITCSGSSAACDVESETADGTFVCRWGCDSQNPDCSETATGCYAPGEFADFVCGDVPYLGE